MLTYEAWYDGNQMTKEWKTVIKQSGSKHNEEAHIVNSIDDVRKKTDYDSNVNQQKTVLIAFFLADDWQPECRIQLNLSGWNQNWLMAGVYAATSVSTNSSPSHNNSKYAQLI